MRNAFGKLFTTRTRAVATVAVACTLAAVAYGAAIVTPMVGEPPAVHIPAPAAPTWRFGFVGDTQLADDRLEPLMRKFAEHDVEFVLHLGDMVDESTSDLEWDRLVAAAMKHRIRLMPVVGNHDVRRDYDDDGAIRFRQYFPDLPNTFYHFRHRGVNFLMLNSERSLVPGSEQASFLRWHLEKHPGTTIVCLHRPTFTVGDRDVASMMLRRLWLHGPLVGTDVVAVLAGHNHYYDRTRPLDGITYVTSGGGGGPQREAEVPEHFTAALSSGKMHFGIARVTDSQIVCEALSMDGERLDEFALELRPTSRKLGGYHNRRSMELPPLVELPQFSQPADGERMAGLRMPRPW